MPFLTTMFKGFCLLLHNFLAHHHLLQRLQQSEYFLFISLCASLHSLECNFHDLSCSLLHLQCLGQFLEYSRNSTMSWMNECIEWITRNLSSQQPWHWGGDSSLCIYSVHYCFLSVITGACFSTVTLAITFIIAGFLEYHSQSNL